ncbi:hypothetical protein PFISCL1PPCAC_17663, partial [Pristionchus fissidentatus]
KCCKISSRIFEEIVKRMPNLVLQSIKFTNIRLTNVAISQFDSAVNQNVPRLILDRSGILEHNLNYMIIAFKSTDILATKSFFEYTISQYDILLGMSEGCAEGESLRLIIEAGGKLPE